LIGIVISSILPPIQAQVKVTQEFTSEHFFIRIGQRDFPSITEILEQFYDHLAEFFQEAPENPIHVVVFDCQADFEEALLEIGSSQEGEGLGGLYSPDTNTAYLWRDESEMHSRSMLLHEVAHAFYRNVAGPGTLPAEWYAEGLADYFALHCWDATVLRTGLRPKIRWEDWPAQALEALEAGSYDLGESLQRAVGFDRPESWAITHFLMTHHPTKLRQLGFTQGDPTEAWEEVFGPLSEDFLDAYARHLIEIQQPWRVLSGAWEECNGTIVGTSSGVGMALLKKTPETFTVELIPEPSSGPSGIVVGFESLDDSHEVTVREGGVLRLDSLVSGHWTKPRMLHNRRRKTTPPYVLTAEKRGGKLHLFSQGKRVAKLPIDGQVGLLVRDGAAAFRVPEIVVPQGTPTP
jgi:hypothetical protein